MQPVGNSIDPMTVEVIQNRLTQIAREAGLALIRTAASPTTVESKDLGFNIADHQGRTLIYSAWMPRHGTTLSFMLRSCISSFGMDQIHPGDVFLVNDPHAGALHVSDIAIIAPVYHRDELVAWLGCAIHHMDIGGINPGWSPWVEDCYQEGLKFPPVKLLERGEFRQDLFDFFLNNVRMPQMQGHDLKAQIAACTVAKKKLHELIERYGFDTIRACYDEILDFSELKAREKIRALPNGRYSFTDYVDFEQLSKIHGTLAVSNGSLYFDFTGTSAETDTFINAALPCSVANIHNIVTCMLFSDVPANEGCFRPVEIFIPERTILNCSHQAPCSGASILGGWKAQCAAIGLLTQVLSRSGNWQYANALWGWGHPMVILTGRSKKLGRFVRSNLGGSMQGGGARAEKDGVNASNIAGSTNTAIPNIESLEEKLPILFLSRRLRPDSGGPGRFRGGLAGEFLFKPHGADMLLINAFHIGKWYPALGFQGGYPGATAAIKVKKAGEEKDLPHRSPLFPLGEEEAILAQCHGGGGYGDSLEREPEWVLRDVRDGFTSLQCAESIYGVSFTPEGTVDQKKTEERRRKLKLERLGKRVEVALSELEMSSPFCRRCDQPMGTKDRPDLTLVEISLASLDWAKSSPLPFRLWGQACPRCGSLIGMQVVPDSKQGPS